MSSTQSVPAMEPSDVWDGATGVAWKPCFVCLFFLVFQRKERLSFGEVAKQAQIGRVKATKRSTAAAHADSVTFSIKLLLLLLHSSHP